jgi:hypothetical protein
VLKESPESTSDFFFECPIFASIGANYLLDVGLKQLCIILVRSLLLVYGVNFLINCGCEQMASDLVLHTMIDLVSTLLYLQQFND